MSSAVMGHLYLRIEDLRRETKQDSQAGLGKLSAVLDKLREDIDDDRQRAAAERATIAGIMVTRAELDRQIDRIIHQLEQNNRRGS